MEQDHDNMVLKNVRALAKWSPHRYRPSVRAYSQSLLTEVDKHVVVKGAVMIWKYVDRPVTRPRT